MFIIDNYMRKRLIVIVLLNWWVFNLIQGQDLNSLLGSWENELGSVLVIDSIDHNSQIIGVYKSSTGVDGKIFSLKGWINQDAGTGRLAIAFSVRWEGYGSITSWTGYTDEDERGVYIKTLWHLIRPQSELPWERIITNASTFRKISE